MSSILTNTKVANEMSELELRARKGDPFAQRQLQRQCMGFAQVIMTDMKAGADLQNRKDMIS